MPFATFMMRISFESVPRELAEPVVLMVAPVAALVSQRKAQLTDVTIGTPSLEDVFIALTGRALR